jgi:hypothetical protein
MMSLPFRIRRVYTSFIDLVGIARLEGQELCLEFRMSSAFARYLKSKPKEVRIALDELEEAVFKHWLCIGMLKLRARRLDAFSQVPGSEGSELRLRCRREHWELAQELASRLNLRTVEHRLRALVAETDRAGQILPQRAGTAEPEQAKRQSREKLAGG